MTFEDLTVITMLSISEMIEKIPSAKMDDANRTISIPIEEYEQYRNVVSLQDKQSIIRDLQHLLSVKDQDLQRYREKYEHTESVLQRTQKALDKRIQVDQTTNSIPLRTTSLRPHPGIISLKRSESRTRSGSTTSNSSGEEVVVSRAVGDGPEKSADAPIASLPNPSARIGLMEDMCSLKSLPLNLSIGSPGMSTALLKRLVQENLKLKAQLERRNIPKSSKDPEKTIGDLKSKLVKKQELINDLLLNQKGNVNGGEAREEILSRLAALHKENDECNAAIEMNKLVISSLKQENSQCKKEKDEMEALLVQYKKYTTDAKESRDRITELERTLKDETESRKRAEAKIESFKLDLEKLKQALEKAEQDRDLAQKNYNTLCSQYHKSSERHSSSQPAYKNQTPQLSAAQMMQQQPASLPAKQLYNMGLAISHNPSYVTAAEAQRYQPRGSHTQPQSLHTSKRSVDSGYSTHSSHSGSQTYGMQPLQESFPNRMSQSAYTPSSPAHQPSHPPLPTERKTFRCPRCDMVFTALQGYREHIKICLKG